jgi:hypothetical protein
MKMSVRFRRAIVITLPILKAQLILIPLATILAAAIAKCWANSALTISIAGTAIIIEGVLPCGPCACGGTGLAAGLTLNLGLFFIRIL